MIIRTAVKGAVLYGAVSLTRQEGVWGNSEESYKLYQKLQKEMEPVCKSVRSKLPFEIPALPSSGEVCFLTNYYYNNAVKASFYHLKMIPCYIGQGVKKASDAIKGATEAKPEAK